MWDALRDRRLGGCKFRRQHPVGQFVLDFFCREKSVAIEVDGKVHIQMEIAAHDLERAKYLELRGITILRFTSGQVLDNLPGVLLEIRKAMEE